MAKLPTFNLPDFPVVAKAAPKPRVKLPKLDMSKHATKLKDSLKGLGKGKKSEGEDERSSARKVYDTTQGLENTFDNIHKGKFKIPEDAGGFKRRRV